MSTTLALSSMSVNTDRTSLDVQHHPFTLAVGATRPAGYQLPVTFSRGEVTGR